MYIYMVYIYIIYLPPGNHACSQYAEIPADPCAAQPLYIPRQQHIIYTTYIIIVYPINIFLYTIYNIYVSYIYIS